MVMPLPIATTVEITAHRFAGWTGTVKAVTYGQYTISILTALLIGGAMLAGMTL